MKPFVRDVPDLRRSADIEVLGGSATEVIGLGQPTGVAGEVRLPEGLAEGAHTSVPRYVLRCEQAHVLEEPGAVLSRGHVLLTENLRGFETAVRGHRPFRLIARSFGPSTDRIASAFVLLGPFSYNYYHWLNDHLPCVEQYLAFRTEGAVERLLVPRWLNDWQRRSLQLLGVEESELVRLGGTHGALGVAFVPASPRFPDDGLPAAPSRASWVRERLRAAVGAPAERPSRRLFVSRRDVPQRRRVANEAEIEALLADRGFEVVVPSAETLEAQVRLFSEARVVVGVHGAGLSNLVFADAPRVLEISVEGRYRPDFQVLTSYVGGLHRVVSARRSDSGAGVVDPSSVLQGLRELSC